MPLVIYAVSAHLFVQQMCDLHEITHLDEFNQYTQKG